MYENKKLVECKECILKPSRLRKYIKIKKTNAKKNIIKKYLEEKKLRIN